MSIQPTKNDLDNGVGSQHIELPKDADHDEVVQNALLDPAAEKRLVWKCDIHVLPAITILFFLAFMDRTNIGEYDGCIKAHSKQN
jgi:hypothetical protein